MATVDKIVSGIKAFWQIVDAITYGFYRELYHGKWIRRGMLGFAAYITYECFDVAWDLAISAPTDNAAMVAAVTTPASALLGSAIKFYNDNRRDEKRFSSEVARGQDDAT